MKPALEKVSLVAYVTMVLNTIIKENKETEVAQTKFNLHG